MVRLMRLGWCIGIFVFLTFAISNAEVAAQLSTGWYGDTKKIAEMETGEKFLPKDIPAEVHFNLWEQIEPYFDDVEIIYFAGANL